MKRLLAVYRAAPVAVVSLFVSSAFGVACSPPTQLQANLRAHPAAENYAAIGEYFGDKGEHECAARAWSSAVKLEPRSAKFSYLLGLNLYFAGQPEPAASALQKSIQLNPKSLQAHMLLATALDQLHRKEEAAKQWRAALEIDPTSTMALGGVARSMLAEEDYRGIVRLLRSRPLDENLALDLAIAYDHTGKLDDAGATLSQALSATPDSLPLANALAILYLKQERHQEAANLIAKQYALHPDDPETQMAYFRIMVANEDREKAVPLGKTLLARSPRDFYVVYLNGLLEREGGDYAAARVHLEDAVQLNPDNADCRYNLGLSLARLHEPAAARPQLEKAIALGWVGPEIHYELANVYRALGESDLAAQQLTIYQAQSRAKQQRTVAANQAAQGDQEIRAGDLAAAEQHFRQAVEANPSLASAWIGLATALAGEAKAAEAKEAVASALRLDPDSAQAQALARELNRNLSDPATKEQL